MTQSNLILIFSVLIYLAAVMLLGILMLKVFRLDFGNAVEARIYQFALGNLIYSLIFIYLGIFHLLYKPILFAAYVIPASFVGIKLVLGMPKIIISLKRSLVVPKLSTEKIVVFLLVAFILFPVIPYLFLFPASWDALAYHLLLPKIYLANHSFKFYNWFAQSAFPIGIESLFGLGEVVGDSRVSNFIVFGFLTAAIIYIPYGLRYLFPKAVLFGALFLFLFRPILYTEVSTTPLVDFPFAFYFLLTSVTLIKFLKSPSFNLLVLLISFALFCLMIKYSGILVFISLSAILLLFSLANFRKIKTLFIPIKFSKKLPEFAILAILLLPILYWPIRNFIYTANPVYPFFNDFFRGLDFDEEQYLALIKDLRSGSISVELLKNFFAGTAENNRLIAESLYFLNLILFSIVGFFRKEQVIKYFSLFGLLFVFGVIFLISFPPGRYGLPAVPVLSIITSYVFFKILRRLNWYRLVMVILAAITIFSQLDAVFERRKVFAFTHPGNSRFSFLSFQEAKNRLKLQDNYAAITYANENLDHDGDKVLVLFDNRLYYLQIPSLYANPSISGLFTNPNTQKVEEVYLAIKKLGVTHLLVNNNWGTPPNLRNDLYQPFMVQYTEPVFSAPGTVLYQVIDEKNLTLNFPRINSHNVKEINVNTKFAQKRFSN